MIIDTLDNLGKYVALNPLFADVVEFLKSHDLQTMEAVTCAETFGYSPLCDLPAFEYNAEKDITKYGDTKPQTYVTVAPGQFAIFFPQDGHAPCIIEEEEIKKAIFKVKVMK